jgi:folate-binding protein YgfZ
MNDNSTAGYDALMNSAGLVDLSSRGRIRITGEDRARLLHAMTTNHVQQMKAGDGLYAFFLNAQGRILADAYVLCFEDHFLLDTAPETRAAVYSHLDQYIIADDVTLEDITEQTFSFGIEGPKAVDIAGHCGMQAPHHRWAHVQAGELEAAAISATGSQGVRVYGPARHKDETAAAIEGAGAIAASPEDAETARIENFVPRYGCDITEHTLPQETQQTHALHFQKGCYLGQEIVERIRSRGHVNRQLMGFRLDGHAVPAPGAQLFAGGKAAGDVTSAAISPDGGVYGLAWVRVPTNKPGTLVGIEGRPAELFAPYGADVS